MRSHTCGSRLMYCTSSEAGGQIRGSTTSHPQPQASLKNCESPPQLKLEEMLPHTSSSRLMYARFTLSGSRQISVSQVASSMQAQQPFRMAGLEPCSQKGMGASHIKTLLSLHGRSTHWPRGRGLVESLSSRTISHKPPGQSACRVHSVTVGRGEQPTNSVL